MLAIFRGASVLDERRLLSIWHSPGVCPANQWSTDESDDVRVCNDEPCEVHAGHYVIRPYGIYCIVALPETEKNTTLSTTAFGESVHFKNDGRKRHRDEDDDE